MNLPYPRHGEICVNVISLINPHVRSNSLGRLVSNDGGIVTGRQPDTVRGGDVAYYSFSRIPQGALPQGYLNVVPELVFEVRSPTDRWPLILAKVAEYLQAGVSVVCVLDQMTATCWVYRADEPPLVLQANDEFHLPDILGDFRVPVSRFFE